MAIYARDAGVWKNVSGGEPTVANANFTNTATGTYTDGDGVDWKYVTFTGTGSLVVDVAGECSILVLGGGSGGDYAAYNGQGGYSVYGTHQITAATHTITIGAGGPSGQTNPSTAGGTNSTLGSLFTGFGAGVGQSLTNFDLSITGSLVTYAASRANFVTANSGDGGNSEGNIAGSSGVVILAVRV